MTAFDHKCICVFSLLPQVVVAPPLSRLPTRIKVRFQERNNSWAALSAAASAHGINPALLGAIGIRESGFMNIPQVGGYGMGVFQLSVYPGSGVTAAQASNFAFASNLAANMLASNMSLLSAQFPSLTPSQLLQATAASFNLGPGGISGNPNTIDVGSTGGNYGSNVVQLMSCFSHP